MKTESKLSSLVASGPVLTDGAWGTELQRRGLEAGECADAWNLTNPAPVEEVALAYSRAGSRVILTNTFRANRISLAGYGLAGQVDGINRAGVRISRQGAADGVQVFASIGPSGKLLAAGDVSEQELSVAFSEQAWALAQEAPDALLIETMSDLTEARLAVRAARATGLPVAVSFVFDHGRNKDRTMTGATPEQAASAMAEEGADAVGANCGQGPEAFLPICRRLRAVCDLPLWIKPNAGLPVLVDGQAHYTTAPEEFARQIAALPGAGASFVGGCCGTTPDFILAAGRVIGG